MRVSLSEEFDDLSDSILISAVFCRHSSGTNAGTKSRTGFCVITVSGSEFSLLYDNIMCFAQFSPTCATVRERITQTRFVFPLEVHIGRRLDIWHGGA